jgi:hypothetical protein
MLMDDSPGSLDFFSDAALNDGGSVFDSLNKILVAQVSHTDTSTMVRVTFNAGNPVPPLPPPATITLTPSSASLRANQQQQFTTNSTKPITWSISPQVGDISQSGLYKSPFRIKGQRTVVVVATDGVSSGSAVVTLVK